ncbi:hypothetical protein PM082_021044 [Marasmius tenuissimus]|nr:hypothetical protein PM082_021044 [Marasmius tenuissimus]
MKDTVRDSFLGQAINSLSGGRLLSYADQRPGYKVPTRYLRSASLSPQATHIPSTEEEKKPNKAKGAKGGSQAVVEVTEVDPDAEPIDTAYPPPPSPPARASGSSGSELELGADNLRGAESGVNAFLVGWEGPDDPDNPKNWSSFKKGFVAFCITLLTFSVYIGSAIYTPSIPGVMEHFDVSQTKATLGLTLYVLAYGVGPMLFTPLQELPSFGRNPVYIIGLAIFLLFNIPIVKASNFATVMGFRFMTGLVGSPALATGGGFAAQAKDWRWPIFELMWIAAFSLGFLTIFLPETFAANILLKRARRLRKLTGNPHLRSQSELDQANLSKKEVAFEALVRPIMLITEPAVLFSNLYIGLVYSVFYLWFEAFPLVFNEIYHMNLGVGSLPFVSFIVSGGISYAAYCVYMKYHLEPRSIKNPDMRPEVLLELGLFSSIFIPVSLFMFGWTARESVHWIAPVIAAALYLPGIFLTFQSVLVYLTVTYYKYAGSVLAGNDLFRSSMAGAFPLFGSAFFRNLGLGPGCSLLAGVSIGLWVVYFALVRYGHVLRARSKYAS